ncbi:hypothetical protein Scep_015026 [Stephania cephalantha]|uniref:Uncharacterized protein n=1 Tax=Stephania cephalantha TaxID=152367 RepID=A0AAP0J3T9_9MAGN
MSTRARKGVLEYEGSHITEHGERDLMIARGGSKLPSLLRTHLGIKKEKKIMCVVVAVVEATEGHEPHEALEEAKVGEGIEVGVALDPQQMKKPRRRPVCFFTRWANRPKSIIELQTSRRGCDLGQCGLYITR